MRIPDVFTVAAQSGRNCVGQPRGRAGVATSRGGLNPAPRHPIVQVASNANLVFLYLTPMVVLPALALHFCVDHKRGMRAIGRLPPERSAESDVKL